MNYRDSKKHTAPDSPPKCQRMISQDMNSLNNIHLQRNNNYFKKRLIMEQENIDCSNIAQPQYQNRKSGILHGKYVSPHQIPKASRIYKFQCNFTDLPKVIHFEILKYLPSKEIIKNIQYLNRYFLKSSNESGLWNEINKIQTLNINLKYFKKACIVERRSKGKLFKAVSRLDNKSVNLNLFIYVKDK